MAHPDAEIIFGAVIHEKEEEGMAQGVRVTVIATGFDGSTAGTLFNLCPLRKI